MTAPIDPTQPFAQGQQDGTHDDSDSGGGNIITDAVGAVGDAVGGAVTGVGAAAIAALITPINTWLANIESGLAHFANVVFNNLFYLSIAGIGIILLLGGLYMMVSATPAGQAIGSAIPKVVPIPV